MSDTYESVSVEIKDHVAQVTLLGPGKGNAMGPAFWAEMPDVFGTLDADPDVRAIVLTGSGKNFSYGLDLPAMGATLPGLDAGAKARSDFHTTLRKMQGAITAVADCRTPTIASIHGWCIGGGVDLISAVDIRYASTDAKFSVRETKLAIVADVGSLARLPLILSDGHLRELVLTGKDVDAARAEKIGLVNDVYADADASLAAAHATATEIAANPPLTVAGVKDVLDQQRTARWPRACAMWPRGIRPSCRRRIWPKRSPRCSRSARPSSPGNRRPAELCLGLRVRQRQPRRAECGGRVRRNQADQSMRNRHRSRPVQLAT